MDALVNTKKILGKFEYVVKPSRISELERAIFHTYCVCYEDIQFRTILLNNAIRRIFLITCSLDSIF